MQTTVYNRKMLEVAVSDMFMQFDKIGELNIKYEKPHKDKTKAQLGFFFSALCGSIQDYFLDLGDEWTIEDIKENFYDGVAHLDDRLVKTVRRFNEEMGLLEFFERVME